MNLKYFSAFGSSKVDFNVKYSQFRRGSFEPSGFSLVIPREIAQRSFRFTPHLYASLMEIIQNVPLSEKRLNQAGILCGSASAGGQILQEQFHRLSEKGVGKVSPFTVPQTIYNSASSSLAIALGCQGITSGYHCAETSGLEALCDAKQFLDSGQADSFFVCAGEELPENEYPLPVVGGAFWLGRQSEDVQRHDAYGKEFSFSVVFNEGKSWLTPQEQFNDVLDAIHHYNSVNLLDDPKEKIVYMNYRQSDLSLPMIKGVEWVTFPEDMYLRSLAPFIVIEKMKAIEPNFKLIVISAEAHAVALQFHL